MLNLAAIAPMLGMIVKLDEIWNVIETTVIFVAIVVRTHLDVVEEAGNGRQADTK